jgi:CheY-specific phosphatase CheX
MNELRQAMNELRQTLDEVLPDVMGKLTFMFVEPAGKYDLTPPTECMSASMTFSGERNGNLTLAVASEVCGEIAANVLGVETDENLTDAEKLDALRETLNVLCGNVLTAVCGESAVFDLSIPETASLTLEGWRQLVGDVSCVGYLVDERPLLVRLQISERQP